jgi:hypothetical protein
MKEIEGRLKTKGIRPDDFRAVCSVLLSKGFLSRADGGDSTRLYDIAARCETELSEYLAFAFPVVLLNTLRPPHFRVVPSHHREVGLVEPDEDLEMRREVKQSVAQSLAATLLALRMLYDEQLLEKKIDVSGRISIKLTELALFMNTTFGMGLPQTKTDQRALFMKLKKHGALDMRIEALGDEDVVIVIRPEILTLVLEQNVRAAQAAFEASSDAPPEDPVLAPTVTPNEAHSAQIITLERTERSSTSRP